VYRLDKLCWESALKQYKASLKRDDLTDEDRVFGAIQAYKRMEDAKELKK
jgi:hypothetical protein